MKKRKNKVSLYKKIFPILLVIATLSMSVGYTTVTGIDLDIAGSVDAEVYEGIFITDVSYDSNVDADTIESTINYYVGTVMDSKIVLGNNSDSSITYLVTVYNNSNKDYMYIDTITDKTDVDLYSNENITFNVEGLESYDTVLMPGDELTFTITFTYTGTDVSNNELLSKINFRFKEVPKISLSNSGNTYTVADVYPDYSPVEYNFSVINSDDTGVNNVPMKYYFDITIDKPLKVVIYDEDGNEVTDGVTLLGDGLTEETHNYSFKVVWDSGNASDDVVYNSADYAGQEFNCEIKLRAVPIDEEYADYSYTDNFDCEISSATYNFVINLSTNLKVEKTATDLNITVKNYSGSDYNIYDTSYDIEFLDNSDFTPSISGVTFKDLIMSKTLSGGEGVSDSYTIKLAADIDSLDVTETINFKITINGPYADGAVIPITLNLQEVVITLDANGGTVSPSSYTNYKGRNYPSLPTPTWTGHTFNGWYTAASGGTKVTSATEITTASNHTLYAQWTSRLLVDHVAIGDYVSYPVSYNNVYTRYDGTLAASSSYTGWRVVGFEGTGDDKYVKLVSAGVPLVYRHPLETSGTTSTSVTALTTNFLSTGISSTVTNYKFIKSGFLTSSGGSTTSISQVKTLFTNDYTQTDSNGNPAVRALTAEDLEAAYGEQIENLTDLTGNTLFGIKAATASGGYSYSGYYLATAYNTTYLWATYYSGYVVYTSGTNGVRAVVLLKPEVEANGQDSSGVWQIKL